MPLENSQNQDINLGKIDPNYSLTREEVIEVLKLTQNSDWNNLDVQIDSNPKIKKLISKDYSQINNARLLTYAKYWVNMKSFQQKLVESWFYLWSFWKNKNWVDWSFWKMTFLSIIKLQKVLWLEANWIINISLLQYLFPKTFRTRNKNEWIWDNKEDVNNSLQLKIKEYNEQKDLVRDDAKDLIWNLLNELTDSKNEIIIPKKEKIKVQDKKSTIPKRRKYTWRVMYATNVNDSNETIEPQIKFYWIWKVRKNHWDKVTNCAWINRQTLQANWINWFHYTAKWKTYSYLQHLLNPKTRDTLLFKRPWHEKITEPKHLFLAFDLWLTNNRRFLKTRGGDLIKETKRSEFEWIENGINNWDIISIVMSSRTTDWKKYWHMATWMKLEWKLYVVDPVFLHQKEPILYSNYMKKLDAHKTWTRKTFDIKWIIVYDKQYNTNESYLASLEWENIQIASNTSTYNWNNFN